jgi:exodeoxyribonuclease V alpha subunit
VDELALKSFGVETDDQRRLQGAVESSLQIHTSNGHTVANHDDIKPILAKLLKSSELAGAALLKSHLKGSFILNYELGTFHPTAMLIMEHVIAKRLLNLTGAPTNWHHEHDQAYHNAIADIPYPLTTQQAASVHMAMANSVSCITGGAGTGKTTVLRTVLMAYNHLQFNIKAIALSGRAAMRMHESTGFITSTIARFLREEPLEGAKYLVVIDEASMLDLQTMYRIVTHITPTTRLLFVGDPDQLPPIGSGLLLADILKSKSIPNTTLDIVKRQKGSTGIPEYSLLIKQGQMPPQLSIGNIYFHDVPAPLITDTCVELYQHQPDVSQIIGATYQGKNGGINELNRRCQDLCNLDGRQLTVNFYGEQQYLDIRENDPIIFTQNDYEASVQNGTLGRLTSVEQTEIHFGTLLTDTGQYIQLTQALLDSIRPGYAISLHKAQGSQFQRVIVPITSSKMVDKNWLYTAITRAEIELHLVGNRALLHKVINRQGHIHKRQTYLAALLNE